MVQKEALIRYFCIALPGQKPQLGFEYVKAMDDAGLDVRVMSIGPAFLATKPWSDVHHLFLTPLAKRFINVVCAPAGYMMGTTVKASDIAPPKSVVGGTEKTPAPHAVVYRPQTALSNLFTVGVTNIAITRSWPQPPDTDELAVLGRYDAVVCPSDKDRLVFEQLGIDARVIDPESDEIAHFLACFLSP